jgi:AcrR family transcriptional regulator
LPKIIENVRESLIKTAREQIKTYGYAGMTIRSVAKECSLGIGTVYNYFKSKEELIHSFMYEDWQRSYDKICRRCEETDEPKEILYEIHKEICVFVENNRTLFSDPNANKVFAAYYVKGHAFLRKQLAENLEVICRKHAKEYTPLLPAFLSESVLVWTAAGKSFEDIYNILKAHFE